MAFKKYPKIERLGHEDNKDIFAFPEDSLVIEEKVDGGNGSFWIEPDDTRFGILHFGSRNRDLTSDEDKKTFAKQQIELREHLEGKKLNPDYVYYIEWMAPHTIKYTNSPSFIGVDIRLKRAKNQEGYGLFLGRERKEQEFNELGIEVVPLIWRGTVEEFKKLKVEDVIPKSKYYNGLAEGIVIKNYTRKHPRENHQLYAKVVREEFKEDNKAIFGGIRQKNTDTQKIIEVFCTDARIRKAILKFVNEENFILDLKLMHKVPTYVIKDILKEEFNGIFEKYSFIDFKEMKQKISKRCLNVLREEIGKKNE